MIKNIFIPEQIGNYYLFPKRILGFDVGRTHITATQVYVRGRTTTIEKIINEPLEAGNHHDYHERASQAIAKIIQQAKRYDAITTALSSSAIVFKELTLPFATREKIALVIDYEIENLLPFPLNAAVTDFIITATSEKKGSSTVLVAAAQKEHLKEHLALFEAANVNPHVVTVDFFSLYGLFNLIPPYQGMTENTVLAIIGFSSTRLAYLEKGQLKFIRTLPKGVTSLVKIISQELHLSVHNAHEQLMRFGFEESGDVAYVQAAQKALADFLVPFQFSLQSFSRQEDAQTQKIIVLGGGAHIRGIAPTLTEKLSMPATLFDVEALHSNAHFSFKEKHHVPLGAVLSISIAIPSSINQTFNLRTQEFKLPYDQHLFTKQVIVALLLIIITLAAPLVNSTFQIQKLNAALARAEKEVLTTVNQEFGITGVRRVDDAIEEANRRVEEQKRTWFAFTDQTRSSFLHTLQTLSKHIDRQSIGLQLKRLSLTHDTLRLQGEVKDIPALIILEDELRQSKLGTFTSPQEPTFTITINLKKGGEEV